jgi:hypothetical protein
MGKYLDFNKHSGIKKEKPQMRGDITARFENVIHLSSFEDILHNSLVLHF